MHSFYNFVSGPLAWVAFLLFFGGSIYRIVSMLRLVAQKERFIFTYMSWRYSLRSIFHWIVPFATVNWRRQPVLTVVTFAFHLCLFAAPLFLLSHAVLWDEAFGISANFSIGQTAGHKLIPAPREVDPIQVQTPRTGTLAVVVPSVETDITWTMPGEMSLFTCSNRVDIYAVKQADGQETRIRRNVETDEGENTIRWQPEAGMAPGRYHIRVLAENGCQGESGIFRIDACDYAIESVVLHGGGSLEAGIDVREHSTVSGTFDVRVRWNGIPVPSNLPPGTSWDNRLTVLSALTGANITHPAEGASFTYRDRPADDGILLVRVPFSFPRDDIPTMRRGRHLPLEFRLRPFGASIDSDPTNNTFNGELRVLGATDNDLRIGIYPSDFNLTRRSRAA